MSRDIFTLRPFKSKVTFDKGPDVTDLPLPTEQDEVRQRMSDELTSLVRGHLTPKEAKQIIPQDGRVCWIGSQETKFLSAISCKPINHKRRVFLEYNESENSKTPQAVIRFTKEQEYSGDKFPNSAYIIKRDVAGTESERIELTALFSDNRSKIVFRRLSSNQIVIEYKGTDPVRAEEEMKKLYANRIDFDLLNNDQMAMQNFFRDMKEIIIFDETSRKKGD